MDGNKCHKSFHRFKYSIKLSNKSDLIIFIYQGSNPPTHKKKEKRKWLLAVTAPASSRVLEQQPRFSYQMKIHFQINGQVVKATQEYVLTYLRSFSQYINIYTHIKLYTLTNINLKFEKTRTLHFYMPRVNCFWVVSLQFFFFLSHIWDSFLQEFCLFLLIDFPRCQNCNQTDRILLQL